MSAIHQKTFNLKEQISLKKKISLCKEFTGDTLKVQGVRRVTVRNSKMNFFKVACDIFSSGVPGLKDEMNSK